MIPINHKTDYNVNLPQCPVLNVITFEFGKYFDISGHGSGTLYGSS